jgi:hypothetical protein
VSDHPLVTQLIQAVMSLQWQGTKGKEGPYGARKTTMSSLTVD